MSCHATSPGKLELAHINHVYGMQLLRSSLKQLISTLLAHRSCKTLYFSSHRLRSKTWRCFMLRYQYIENLESLMLHKLPLSRLGSTGIPNVSTFSGCLSFRTSHFLAKAFRLISVLLRACGLLHAKWRSVEYDSTPLVQLVRANFYCRCLLQCSYSGR